MILFSPESYLIAKICESASFWKLVEKERYHKTHPDMDDGFGDFTPSFREYSRPRGEMRSRVLGAISEGTVIEPALQFVMVKIVGTYGIEIEIPSPSRSERHSWVMPCREMNRYMDEAPIPKSENKTTRELITERAVEEKQPCSMELGQSRTEETRVKGSTQAHEEPICKHAHVFLLEPNIHQSHPWRRWGLRVTSALTPS